jgi:plastocyanin
MSIGKHVFMKSLLALVLIPTMFSVAYGQGTKHTVVVNGSYPNYVFSPDSLQVNVGDVIEWSGAFGAVGTTLHTVTSESVPAGANTFDVQSGSVFDYTVTTPGNYFYVCQNHFACCHMAGGFLTQASGVNWPTDPAPFELFQTSPNPAANSTEISFNMRNSGTAILLVFDERGAVVAPLLAEHVDAGLHKVNFDTSKLPSGVYFYQLDANGSVVRKQMIVQR